MTTNLEILIDGQFIESIIGNNQEYIVEDDISVLESVSHKEALKVTMILTSFLLQYEKIILKLLSALLKIKSQIHLDFNFKKKKTTLDSYFKASSSM